MSESTTLDKFTSIIRDFTSDLSITFPEYTYLWSRWNSSETPVSDYADLYQYCLKVYPERFFDILYQNDDIFLLEKPDENPDDSDKKINTLFLPYVEFKLLFHCEGISENTKKTIWKYLQLIMVTIMGDIQDKSVFGDTANLFDGIEEGDLHTKLADTINGLSNFFKTSGMDSDEVPDLENTFEKAFEQTNETFKNMFENSDISGGFGSFDNSSMPNPDDLNDHLKSLFGGKIGTLAKELAEELSDDVMQMFGQEGEEIKSTQDVLKKIMRNPKKMMDLLKTVSSKLDTKMKDGDISQADIMKEAGDLMGKMKDMGGGKEFQDMMRNMTKGMAGMSGLGGKNTRLDKGAMDRMMKSESMKERMRNKLQEKALNKSVILEPSLENPQNMVFKIDGDEGQQKSSARPPENDDWLDEPVVSNKPANKSDVNKKKKKGKK
jgi:hypothetical protein